MTARELWQATKTAGSCWLEHKVPRLSAALAYYALLSLAPLLVISVAVGGLVYGQDAARGQIASELANLVGWRAAEGVQTVLASARSHQSGLAGVVIGAVTLVLGASGVFNELQESLNVIWRVKPKARRTLLDEMRDRLWSFLMVLVVAALLLASTVATSILSWMSSVFSTTLPGGELSWQVVDAGLSFAVLAVCFAGIFKLLPDAPVAWGQAWIGGAVTGLFFSLGKLGIGLYLGHAAVGSSYGAAGSLIALLVWVYYAAQIFFFGAELTCALKPTPPTARRRSG